MGASHGPITQTILANGPAHESNSHQSVAPLGPASQWPASPQWNAAAFGCETNAAIASMPQLHQGKHPSSRWFGLVWWLRKGFPSPLCKNQSKPPTSGRVRFCFTGNKKAGSPSPIFLPCRAFLAAANAGLPHPRPKPRPRATFFARHLARAAKDPAALSSAETALPPSLALPQGLRLGSKQVVVWSCGLGSPQKGFQIQTQTNRNHQ